jgi:hypothetical protein
MADAPRPRITPEQAVEPFLLSFDEDSLTDEECALLDIDRKLAAMRGVTDIVPGTGMGEYVTGVEEQADGRVQVFTQMNVVRETQRRFTLRARDGRWVIERCEEPRPVCHGTGRCHLCGESAAPGRCHCCGGKGYHKDRILLIIPAVRTCSFCEGTGNCLSCSDGVCATCRGRGWMKSLSFNPGGK